MTEPVSLIDIKVHLNLSESDTGADANLDAMIIAARRTAELQINRSIADTDMSDDDRAIIAHVIRLLVGGWHANREAVVTGIVNELPFGVAALLRPLRRISAPDLP